MPNPTIVLAESTQYIYVQITSSIVATPYNPTSLPVAVAITPPNVPPTVFTTAAWLAGQAVPTVKFLIGPLNGGMVLAPGDYDVYIQITNTPEVPVIPSGHLRIISASS